MQLLRIQGKRSSSKSNNFSGQFASNSHSGVSSFLPEDGLRFFKVGGNFLLGLTLR